ncbi:MAG: hypothetical protein JKY37_17375 [Nannocystaceae bacterium]|nr:hypothetical protein [Nannocystaceae bacterium]
MVEQRTEHAGHHYCPFYCEENVWHLCGDAGVPAGPRAAIFISNAARSVAIAHQRIADVPGLPVVWDYHVVMATRHSGHGWGIWDLDSVLGLDVPLTQWLEQCMGGEFGFGSDDAPQFRVVQADEYRRALSSDRSHMCDEHGNYQALPPTWSKIGSSPNNLMAFVAMQTGFIGEVVDAARLPAALDASVGLADAHDR